jgi:hypothetical protein
MSSNKKQVPVWMWVEENSRMVTCGKVETKHISIEKFDGIGGWQWVVWMVDGTTCYESGGLMTLESAMRESKESFVRMEAK